jgi:hypothetical protein
MKPRALPGMPPEIMEKSVATGRRLRPHAAEAMQPYGPFEGLAPASTPNCPPQPVEMVTVSNGFPPFHRRLAFWG